MVKNRNFMIGDLIFGWCSPSFKIEVWNATSGSTRFTCLRIYIEQTTLAAEKNKSKQYVKRKLLSPGTIQSYVLGLVSQQIQKFIMMGIRLSYCFYSVDNEKISPKN